MQITTATARGDGAENEDYVACGPDWILVLDGATVLPGVETGCVHSVPWLVRHLAAGITGGLLRGEPLLAGIVHGAIGSTMAAHTATCDLANPDSPSSTVAIVRQRGDATESFVLGDSPVILRCGDTIMAAADRRLDQLPGGRPYSRELVRKMRNAPGGFWVASTKPEAARQAITGTVAGVTEAIVLTDGVTRLVDFYGWTWPQMFTVLREEGGPTGLIQRVRVAETAAPPPHGKPHDDVAVAYARWVGRPADEPFVPDRLVADRVP